MPPIPPFEGYVDTLAFLGDVGPPMFDRATLDRVRASGVTLFNLTTALPFQDWQASLDQHERVIRSLKEHDDLFQVVQEASDLSALGETDKIGVIPGIQDPAFIASRIDRLNELFDRGVRIMQVAYQKEGPFGAGFLCTDPAQGLTPLGRDFVTRVARAGMILDLSHLAPRTALDCLETAAGPVMISHTTSRDLYPHLRGAPDTVLRALAARKDTLVGVLAMTFFLDGSDVGLEPLVRHMRRIADLVGEERTALGSDGPIGGFTDVGKARETFEKIMQARMDPEGALGSRWPTHIPDMAFGPGGIERLAEALKGAFDPKAVQGILGENGYRWFSRALPGGDLW
jgi:microsomal dipeptidase-like Zn-dependent dipeptidase